MVRILALLPMQPLPPDMDTQTPELLLRKAWEGAAAGADLIIVEEDFALRVVNQLRGCSRARLVVLQTPAAAALRTCGPDYPPSGCVPRRPHSPGMPMIVAFAHPCLPMHACSPGACAVFRST